MNKQEKAGVAAFTGLLAGFGCYVIKGHLLLAICTVVLWPLLAVISFRVCLAARRFAHSAEVAPTDDLHEGLFIFCLLAWPITICVVPAYYIVVALISPLL